MELFNNNYFFIYIWICLSIFNYSNFTDTHKVITLYFINFSVIILNIFNFITSIALLLISLFIFLEIFSNDTVKMTIFDKLWDKLLDYFFIIFFQYSFLMIVIELFILHYAQHELVHIFAISLFLLTIIHITQEKFRTETISDLKAKFHPSINQVNFGEIEDYTFQMLIDLEDRTYRKRKYRSTFLSINVVKHTIQNVLGHKKSLKRYIRNTNLKRGYSTIQMQLIRTIGITQGFGTLPTNYNVCQYFPVIRRKIYELIYAEIFFNGLRRYYKKNVYVNAEKYPDYLLYIYLKYAPTIVGKTRYSNILEYLGDDPKLWTKEKCLIAYAGLPYVGVGHGLTSQEILNKHQNQISKYGLDKQTINNLVARPNNI